MKAPRLICATPRPLSPPTWNPATYTVDDLEAEEITLEPCPESPHLVDLESIPLPDLRRILRLED